MVGLGEGYRQKMKCCGLKVFLKKEIAITILQNIRIFYDFLNFDHPDRR